MGGGIFTPHLIHNQTSAFSTILLEMAIQRSNKEKLHKIVSTLQYLCPPKDLLHVFTAFIGEVYHHYAYFNLYAHKASGMG